MKELNIPNFKLVEFEQFKINAGSNTFILPLNKIARNQLKSLIDNYSIKNLENLVPKLPNINEDE